jgi:hypothetical protein
VLSPERVRRTRIILLLEVALAVILGVVLHPLLFVFLLLPVAELLVKPSSQRAQILGLKS